MLGMLSRFAAHRVRPRDCSPKNEVPFLRPSTRRSGVRRLAGSFLTFEEPIAPAQVPSLPLRQLQPNMAEIKIAEDYLKPRKIVREGKKKSAPKKSRKPLTARQRYGLTRLEVSALLDKPDVASALPPWMCSRYRTLANRNISIEQLATEDHLSVTAMEAVVEGWESDIVAKTCELYPKFRPRGSESRYARSGEKTEEESLTAQDREVLKSGGRAIGGRIVSGGKHPVTGRPKKLSDFERSGRLKETGCDQNYDRTGSKISEEDDYGEDSNA